MTPQEEARSRLEMLGSIAGERVSPRTLARRVPAAIHDTGLDPATAKRIAAFRAPRQRERFARRAAAVLNANDLALLIDRAARAELERCLSQDDRLFALQHRNLARPARRAIAASVCEQLEADRAELEANWLIGLPSSLLEALGAEPPDPLCPMMQAAIEIVLAAEAPA